MVRKLGKYIIGETLGEGGFSTVKLGVHEVTGEKVALKILKTKALNMEKTSKMQVEREIASMTKIQHKNVLRLKHVDWNAVYEKKNGKKVDVILVVLELATGGELFEFLSFTGPFEEAIARTYFHQLMAGIGYCHAQGVVHRDLKPENLLLDENFQLKLADFGFAKVYSTASAKTMYTECGTPGYMAPEMSTRQGYDAPLVDIWACGVVLFIMLAGFPPFQKPNKTDWWFHKLANNKHSLFWQAHSRSAYFSEPLKDLINKILQPDPTKRISVDDIRKHEWFTGPTITEEQLFQELSRRKQTVDEQKNMERREKERATVGQSAGGNLNGVTCRAIGEEGGEMSEEPPALHPGVLADVFVADENAVTGGEEESPFDMGGLNSMMEEPQEQKISGEVPKYEPQTECFTAFRSTADPSDLVEKVLALLGSMGGQSESEGFNVRSSLTTERGKMILTAKVFADESEKNNVVEVRRLRGDAEQFRAAYWELRSKMGDMAITKAPENLEEKTAATEEKSA